MREDLKKILDEMEEVKKRDEQIRGIRGSALYFQTSAMHMENLKRKYRRRASMEPYGETLYLKLYGGRMPNVLDKILHVIGLHFWIDAEDEGLGSVRICPLCGLVEWTIYPRSIDCWKEAPFMVFPEDFMEFLKEFYE